jgi:hypothetical protein
MSTKVPENVQKVIARDDKLKVEADKARKERHAKNVANKKLWLSRA